MLIAFSLNKHFLPYLAKFLQGWRPIKTYYYFFPYSWALQPLVGLGLTDDPPLYGPPLLGCRFHILASEEFQVSLDVIFPSLIRGLLPLGLFPSGDFSQTDFMIREWSLRIPIAVCHFGWVGKYLETGRDLGVPGWA